MKFKTLASIVILMLASTSASAQTTAPAGPDQVLKEGLGKLTIFLQTTNPDNTRQIQAYLDTEIAPYFDFGYMAKWVAGPTRRYMNAGQFAQFEQGLQRVFLAAMASKMIGVYDGRSVKFQRVRRGARPNEAVAGILIAQKNMSPIRLDFRFYNGRNGWRIFDVMSNGSSAVMYYRSYYSRLIRRYGIAGVLRQMG